MKNKVENVSAKTIEKKTILFFGILYDCKLREFGEQFQMMCTIEANIDLEGCPSGLPSKGNITTKELEDGEKKR